MLLLTANHHEKLKGHSKLKMTYEGLYTEDLVRESVIAQIERLRQFDREIPDILPEFEVDCEFLKN